MMSAATSAVTNMMLRRLSASASSISGPSAFLHFISTLHEESFLITLDLTFLFGKTLPQKLPEIPTFCFQFCSYVTQRYFQYCTKKCWFIPDSWKKFISAYFSSYPYYKFQIWHVFYENIWCISSIYLNFKNCEKISFLKITNVRKIFFLEI